MSSRRTIHGRKRASDADTVITRRTKRRRTNDNDDGADAGEVGHTAHDQADVDVGGSELVRRISSIPNPHLHNVDDYIADDSDLLGDLYPDVVGGDRLEATDPDTLANSRPTDSQCSTFTDTDTDTNTTADSSARNNRGRRKKRAASKMATNKRKKANDDRNVVPICIEPEISEYLFSPNYEEIDVNCFGCDYISDKPTVTPIQREQIKQFFEMMAACVYSGQLLVAARQAHQELEAFRERVNPRLPPSVPKYREWPVWQIVRHLYLHCNDPVIQTYLETQLARRHMLRIGFTQIYEQYEKRDGTRHQRVNKEGFEAYTKMQMMVLRLRSVPVRKMNFYSSDTDRAAPNPFIGISDSAIFQFYARKPQATQPDPRWG